MSPPLRTSYRLGIGLVSACIFALLSAGCEYVGCGGDKVATLADLQGPVERDRSTSVNEWQTASRGDAFRKGDGIRTRKGATAELTLTAGGVVALEENTLIRFTAGGQGAGVDIAMGSATVHAVGGGLVFSTQQGDGQLEDGAKARITASTEGLVYEMLDGRGIFFHKDGTSRTLGSDERLVYNTKGILVSGLDSGLTEAGIEAGIADAGMDAGDAGPDAGEALASRITVTAGRLRIRSGRGRWKNLSSGDEAPWEPGLRVQVLRNGKARIERGGQVAELQGDGRHHALSAEAGLADVGEGRVLLSGSGETSVRIPGGSVTNAPDSRTLIIASRRGTRITVSKGSAKVQHGKQSSELSAGDSLALTRAGGVDEDQPNPPDRAHFFLGLGDSVTVHDARAPTHVGFRFGEKCPEGGVVTVKRGSREYMTSAGQGAANVLMPPGHNRYEVRCTGGSQIASGSVTVMRDSGRTALPRSAPPTLVDTDGRNYRVLYQNLLPEVTVRWRKAPSGGSYTLSVTTNGKTETFKSSSASYKFDSGALTEGQHRLVFSAGAKKSKPTNLFIRFDNAAPKARITSPYDGTFSPGSTVQVSGVALKGWKAYVGSQALSMDRQHRFTGSVQVPAGQDGLVVRLTNPGRGTHYYLRRAK